MREADVRRQRGDRRQRGHEPGERAHGGPVRGGQRGEQGDIGDQRDQVGVPVAAAHHHADEVHRGRGDQCDGECGPAPTPAPRRRGREQDERRHPAHHEQPGQLVRALHRCPGVAGREHRGGIGAEADDLVPPRGQRGRGRRDPDQADQDRQQTPEANRPATRTRRRGTRCERQSPTQEHRREDQPADQALLEATRRTADAPAARASRPAGVRRRVQGRTTSSHDSATNGVPSTSPLPVHAVRSGSASSVTVDDRGQPGRPVAGHDAGGEQVHGDDQSRGAATAAEHPGTGPAEQRVGPAVRRDQHRRPVHPVAAVQAVGRGRPGPGDQQESGLVRARGGQNPGTRSAVETSTA